jgi:RNA recognition motif-containing protein
VACNVQLRINNWICGVFAANPVMGLAAFLIPVSGPEKAVFQMEVRLHVGNLSKETTQEELNTLFSQAGNVTATEMIRERRSGESRGFAFVTMSEQSEADKAISMFDAYALGDHTLKVSMARPKEARPVSGNGAR